MAFDDLDLEFEDEDDAKKKKSEAVHVDVDLEFNSPEGGKPRPTQPPARPASAGTAINIPRIPPSAGQPQQQATVRKIEDARAAQTQVRPGTPSGQSRPGALQPRAVGSSAIKEDRAYDPELQPMVEMREQMRKVEFDAEVRVLVAEFKTEILSEVLGDMKLVEHHIGQLLSRINTKHPDMKNEVLMIKKILADFTAKKRK